MIRQLQPENPGAGAAAPEKTDLLIVTDCALLVGNRFCQRFSRGWTKARLCPHFDGREAAARKIQDLLHSGEFASVLAVSMDTPCCTALASIVRDAALETGADIPVNCATLDLEGRALSVDLARR